jgi:hypothetical protein
MAVVVAAVSSSLRVTNRWSLRVVVAPVAGLELVRLSRSLEKAALLAKMAVVKAEEPAAAVAQAFPAAVGVAF